MLGWCVITFNQNTLILGHMDLIPSVIIDWGPFSLLAVCCTPGHPGELSHGAAQQDEVRDA